jgi:hypothetical protein
MVDSLSGFGKTKRRLGQEGNVQILFAGREHMSDTHGVRRQPASSRQVEDLSRVNDIMNARRLVEADAFFATCRTAGLRSCHRWRKREQSDPRVWPSCCLDRTYGLPDENPRQVLGSFVQGPWVGVVMGYRQASERVELSIEQDTENVPNDGLYYVLLKGQVVGRYRHLRKAQQTYRETLDSLNLTSTPDPSAEDQRAAALKSEAEAVVDKMELETFQKARRRRRTGRRTRTFR